MLILLVVLVVFISSCNKPEVKTNETIQEEGITGEMTKEMCDEAGGHWNECGSPCAGTGAEICIQMCSAQCECGGIAGFRCPEGYKCRLSGRTARDEMGVCVREVVFDD